MTVTPGDRPDTVPEPSDSDTRRRLAEVVAERFQLRQPAAADQQAGQATIAPAWRSQDGGRS